MRAWWAMDALVSSPPLFVDTHALEALKDQELVCPRHARDPNTIIHGCCKTWKPLQEQMTMFTWRCKYSIHGVQNSSILYLDITTMSCCATTSRAQLKPEELGTINQTHCLIACCAWASSKTAKWAIRWAQSYNAQGEVEMWGRFLGVCRYL